MYNKYWFNKQYTYIYLFHFLIQQKSFQFLHTCEEQDNFFVLLPQKN